MPPPIKKTIIITFFIVISMFSFSFAISPLYSALCKYTDFNTAKKIENLPPDFSQPITIQFVTTNNENLPWAFYPKIASLNVELEQNNTVFFYAKNLSEKTITVQAIPSFSPPDAAAYFKKTECFCFNKQTLKPGEAMEMPVVFRLMKSLPNRIHTITLSYTLFDVTNGKTKRITQ